MRSEAVWDTAGVWPVFVAEDGVMILGAEGVKNILVALWRLDAEDLERQIRQQFPDTAAQMILEAREKSQATKRGYLEMLQEAITKRW